MSRQILSISVILVFIFTAISFAADPNLVGWWKLDSGAGDSSGNGYDGIIVGDPNWVIGQIDGALDLDGLDDCVDTNSADLDLLGTDTITVSAWICPRDQTYDVGLIVNDYDKNNTLGWHIVFGPSNTFRAVNADSTKSRQRQSSVLDLEQWYHVVAIIYPINYPDIYVNGQLDNNPFSSGDPTTQLYMGNGNVLIGRQSNPSERYFNGKIDDVRIYNRALTDGEIAQFYGVILGGKAFNPNPENSDIWVDPNIVLSWSPGIGAADVNGHNVYFGTDYNDVNDANTAITLGVYQGRQDANFWDPCGLEWGKWYYWRIDEVNDANDDSPWRGNVWSFETAAPFIELSATQFEFWSGWVTNPDDQILSIHNNGIGTLNWEISYDCNWLTVEPNIGSSTGTPNEVTLGVDIAGLAEGEYECELIVSDPCAINSPQTITVMLIFECFPSCHPHYSVWRSVGRPDCWCNPRQCHGNADGRNQGKSQYRVSTWDLDVLIGAWNKRYEDIAGQTVLTGGGDNVPMICADFNHIMQGKGAYRVSTWDLDILVTNWNIPYPKPDPDCLDCP